MPHVEGTEWNAQPHGAFPDQLVENAEFMAEVPLSKRRKRTITIGRSRPVDLIRGKTTIYIPQLLQIPAALHQFHHDRAWKAKRRIIEENAANVRAYPRSGMMEGWKQ